MQTTIPVGKSNGKEIPSKKFLKIWVYLVRLVLYWKFEKLLSLENVRKFTILFFFEWKAPLEFPGQVDNEEKIKASDFFTFPLAYGIKCYNLLISTESCGACWVKNWGELAPVTHCKKRTEKMASLCFHCSLGHPPAKNNLFSCTEA